MVVPSSGDTVRGMTQDRLVLIRQWSMAGALDDVERDFGSPVDIHTAVGERPNASEMSQPPDQPPVLLKSAGDGDWHPLPGEPLTT